MHLAVLLVTILWLDEVRPLAGSRWKRAIMEDIVETPEMQVLARARCKANCLLDCVQKMKQVLLSDSKLPHVSLKETFATCLSDPIKKPLLIDVSVASPN
ncbi:hypothetical protein Ciccas_000928 [Cichlidogyrus casuarinus]|uniref:Uncharacterized protein n=1 Tax=Cichlidogyrus casuarinus TaxID=1844966 RepID=A0ABD2QLJ3_9PLAT